LVELLVVMVIISIMAGAVMAGLQKAQNTAREARTKATIAKLNHFITLKMESYKTRRIVIVDSSAQEALAWAPPPAAAMIRLYGVRDLMRMEMPERPEDITSQPFPITTISGLSGSFNVPPPSLYQLYNAMYSSPGNYGRQAMGGTYATTQVGQYQAMMAKCLYLTVMTGNGEARQQFQQNEIMVDSDGWSMFVDGWGRPIVWLRWAPSCSQSSPVTDSSGNVHQNLCGISNIQSGNPITDHDPFDPRNFQSNAFQLIPLILSSAGHKDSSGNDCYGVALEQTDNNGNPLASSPTLDPFDSAHIVYGGPPMGSGGQPLPITMPIHNHYIESR
jgi:hypothetical protein